MFTKVVSLADNNEYSPKFMKLNIEWAIELNTLKYLIFVILLRGGLAKYHLNVHIMSLLRRCCLGERCGAIGLLLFELVDIYLLFFNYISQKSLLCNTKVCFSHNGIKK